MSDAAWALENLARAKQTLPNGYCGPPLQQTSRIRTRACLRQLQRGHAPLSSNFKGRLHAPGEELIGQVAVCQCRGELQRADHQSDVDAVV